MHATLIEHSFLEVSKLSFDFIGNEIEFLKFENLNEHYIARELNS